MITLAEIEEEVQFQLRNMVDSPVSQTARISAYNAVLDFLQSKAHWNATKKRAYFDFLVRETDYSLANNLGVSDFKGFKDLRFPTTSSSRQSKEYEEIEANDFSILAAQNTFNNWVNFEDREGDLIMRVLSIFSNGKAITDPMDDLTTGRTWQSDVTGSDATTLVEDTNLAKVGNSLKFDIDVSQSVNDFAQMFTSTVFTTPIDGSLVENTGHWRFWAGLHSMSSANLALITSMTFVWGSDASATPLTKANYWSKTVTAPAEGGDFQKTFNRMSFDWDTATKVGAPDSSDLKYFEVKITYANGMTDTRNIRIDEIALYTPLQGELVYFSNDMVSKDGVWQEHFTNTSGGVDTAEQLLLPQRQFNLIVHLSLKKLFPQKQKSDKDYIRVSNEADTELALAIQQDGNPITREKYAFELDGASNGRADGETQW